MAQRAYREEFETCFPQPHAQNVTRGSGNELAIYVRKWQETRFLTCFIHESHVFWAEHDVVFKIEYYNTDLIIADFNLFIHVRILNEFFNSST